MAKNKSTTTTVTDAEAMARINDLLGASQEAYIESQGTAKWMPPKGFYNCRASVALSVGKYGPYTGIPNDEAKPCVVFVITFTIVDEPELEGKQFTMTRTNRTGKAGGGNEDLDKLKETFRTFLELEDINDMPDDFKQAAAAAAAAAEEGLWKVEIDVFHREDEPEGAKGISFAKLHSRVDA